MFSAMEESSSSSSTLAYHVVGVHELFSSFSVLCNISYFRICLNIINHHPIKHFYYVSVSALFPFIFVSKLCFSIQSSSLRMYPTKLNCLSLMVPNKFLLFLLSVVLTPIR